MSNNDPGLLAGFDQRKALAAEIGNDLAELYRQALAVGISEFKVTARLMGQVVGSLTEAIDEPDERLWHAVELMVFMVGARVARDDFDKKMKPAVPPQPDHEGDNTL